ncbi:8-oxo-dGTP diphosphatase [Marinilactibacillus sp. Marseille-P9653]|uniref:8-oxo-dGTP diphosphatase n=1 Tax=Marinilactibacillus sp. Marseille-P9653 TaxID=2866583 RepID=UPI001CE42613|nr:8-oxo-dGTP diphosphatase [Marinilactibacillus sp. Marseille-P9653]
MEKVILTNMIMIEDGKGNVVVQNRVKSWRGLAFPGGKVDARESFVESAIREAKEETGLDIENLQICGVKQFQTDSDVRYIVFLYKTNTYKGTLTSSDEGEVNWISLDRLKNADTVEDFDQLLEVFLNPRLSELYYEQDQARSI